MECEEKCEEVTRNLVKMQKDFFALMLLRAKKKQASRENIFSSFRHVFLSFLSVLELKGICLHL